MRALLLERGFAQSIWDPCVFIRFESGLLQGIVGLRADDALMASSEEFWNVVDFLPLQWGSRSSGDFVLWATDYSPHA
eukprot:7382828-Pyramimonas_sp.AAC.1